MKNTYKLIGSSLIGAVFVTAVSSTYAGNDHATDLAKNASITMQQAVEIALAKIPGTAVESELELEDGQLVWEVNVVNDSNENIEFEIDAITGNILEQEKEDH